MHSSNDVLEFWLNAGPKAWFSRSDIFDASLNEKFGPLLERAAAKELKSWEDEPDSALALVIVLDQFSRNLFRNDARAFAQDSLCLGIAKSALEKGFDLRVEPQLRQFFLMPLMHSESIHDQRRCVALFHAVNMPDNLKFAILHRDIIERFGHFPHRNSLLGRATSSAEQAFLDGGGFSG